MLSDSPCKDDHALFSTVPLKPYKDTNNFEIDYFGFATKQIVLIRIKNF